MVSPHQCNHQKAKRLIGLVYRNFYLNSTSNTLLSLYKSIIRPILEYGCTVWDPSSISASYSLEAVQYFALKMIAKSWSSSYSSLLSSLKVQTLSQQRRKHKIILFFKISQDISHTLSPPLKIATRTRPLRSQSKFDFKVPFCRTQTFYQSFFPTSIRLWNSLPNTVKSSHSISLLKSHITSFSN